MINTDGNEMEANIVFEKKARKTEWGKVIKEGRKKVIKKRTNKVNKSWK